jgi:hypothetical protein
MKRYILDFRSADNRNRIRPSTFHQILVVERNPENWKSLVKAPRRLLLIFS